MPIGDNGSLSSDFKWALAHVWYVLYTLNIMEMHFDSEYLLTMVINKLGFVHLELIEAGCLSYLKMPLLA